MILFGRKAHHLGLQQLNDSICPKCGQKKTVVSVFQMYYHILWVPFFPLRKKTAAQCLACNHVILEKKYDVNQQTVKEQLKDEYRTPIWTFSGLFLVVLFILVRFMFLS